MNVAKTAIATTLALAALFSSTANARISGEQIEPLTTSLLAAAVSSPNKAFAQCVDKNFYLNVPDENPPLLHKFNEQMFLAISAGLVDDEVTFSIAANDLLKQVCGDSQMAGGGKKSK
jgi:hypothetical protein